LRILLHRQNRFFSDRALQVVRVENLYQNELLIFLSIFGGEGIMSGQDKTVAYKTGKIPVYCVEPVSGKGVGVVVVSAIFGVDGDTQKICSDLAAAGHPAMALDMFWEDDFDTGALDVSPENVERARARAGRVDRADGNAYISTVLDAMKALESCNGKVTVFGFCYGGPYVVEAAAHLGIDGGVSFHGSFVENFLPEFANITCPLAFHYGDNDAVAPMEAIDQVKAECKKHDNADVYVYPGGEHGYMFPNRGAGYQVEAAQLSWGRALEFLSTI
jgi:carboxymethylenebutenolidase